MIRPQRFVAKTRAGLQAQRRSPPFGDAPAGCAVMRGVGNAPLRRLRDLDRLAFENLQRHLDALLFVVHFQFGLVDTGVQKAFGLIKSRQVGDIALQDFVAGQKGLFPQKNSGEAAHRAHFHLLVQRLVGKGLVARDLDAYQGKILLRPKRRCEKNRTAEQKHGKKPTIFHCFRHYRFCEAGSQ